MLLDTSGSAEQLLAVKRCRSVQKKFFLKLHMHHTFISFVYVSNCAKNLAKAAQCLKCFIGRYALFKDGHFDVTYVSDLLM